MAGAMDSLQFSRRNRHKMEKTNRLLRIGLTLEYFTLSWNVVGVVILSTAAFRAHSVALAAFGIDSLIEIGASVVVVWQLTGADPNRRSLALRLISLAFFTLAAYVLIQSAIVLFAQARPEQSAGGIVWLALTLFAMLALAFGKERIGAKLGNMVLKTEARVTLVDAYLAASVLLGLILNAVFHWWWADPVAALVIVFYGFREGLHAGEKGRQIPISNPLDHDSS
jgi:divalent metal cation (Fe/Co/Zn/Cd) transporter